MATAACPVVHAAFYLWYATPAHDGKWAHWDHAVLPHWSEATRLRFPHGMPFRPPEEPHSPFYPSRGLYSSADPLALKDQMQELAHAGVDTVMLSWWGRADANIRRDSQGVSTDELVPAVLEAAAAAGIGVTWHLEPYGGRSPATVREDLHYLHRRYGGHPGVWRQSRGESDEDGPLVPVVFLYDVSAEHSGPSEADRQRAAAAWKEVATAIRGTAHDAMLISLYVDERDVAFVSAAGLDGAYSYFAAEGFTHGAQSRSWAHITRRLAKDGKTFFPSVGPGYNDTLIRPWNYEQTHSRDEGRYYDRMWEAAVGAQPAAITITSYNEWGEGTQIEPARPHTSANGSVYADYAPNPANYYMGRTKVWAEHARSGGCRRRGLRRSADQGMTDEL